MRIVRLRLEQGVHLMSSNTLEKIPTLAAVDRGTLFGQTMGLVAATAGFFTLGAYLARDVSAGWSLVLFIGSFAAIFALPRATRRSKISPRPAAFCLGADRVDRIRSGAGPGPDPERAADLHGDRTADLRWTDGLRLPTTAPNAGHPRGAVDGGLDISSTS